MEQTLWKPKVFITGGQSGADSIPFTIHKQLGIDIQGWMPKDFRREGGDGKEIAAKYGLKEGEGGYAWRDKRNVSQSDALVAFLTDRPRTGKGTMQTANMFRCGKYAYVQLDKPGEEDWVVLEGGKPVLVFWDGEEGKMERWCKVLRDFVNCYRPVRLMFAGSCESTVPGIERFGAELLLRTFGEKQ
eukprot:TRINITY_DN21110_c0_g1_i1.p1 TRINITY_DN21110_c0_g1~~TRINITY_DN21110_c0_g1_i1.p1  ORF type:complete len:187 (-),score=60.58 TRINITY_DN21110_c0_g1_i1:46-606(-)